MRYIFLILLALTRNAYSGEMGTTWYLHSNSVAQVTLSMSFDGLVTFDLRSRGADHKLFVRREQEDIAVFEDVIHLDDKVLSEILLKIDDALDINKYDTFASEDGSSWCLKFTPKSATTILCALSPTYKSEDRGVEGLHHLGIYLASLFPSNEIGTIY